MAELLGLVREPEVNERYGDLSTIIEAVCRSTRAPQNLATKPLEISHGVLPFVQEQSINRPNVVASLLAEVAKNVVLHFDSAPIFRREPLAQLF
jgi:hypothetical protein